MHFGWRGEWVLPKEATTISMTHLVQSKWLELSNGQTWWKLHDRQIGIPLPTQALPDLIPNRTTYLFGPEGQVPDPLAVERPPTQAFHNQYSRRRRGGSSSTNEECQPSHEFEQRGPSSTFEFGGTSHAAPPPPPSPHTDPDLVLAFLQHLHLRMDGFDQRFDRIEAETEPDQQFMVDFQRSQYPIYDHHYRQGHIALDHGHLSCYTPPPGDFGYVYGFEGDASTSFSLEAQEERDDDEEDEEDEEGDESDD